MLSAFTLLLALQSSITPAQSAAIQAQWWAKDSLWEAHTKDVMHQLFACREGAPVMDRAPCNHFVGEYLRRVYGLEDFSTQTGFLTADQMISKIYSAGSSWSEIGSAAEQSTLNAAQDRANSRSAVIALYPSISGKPGHVALILPGKTRPSSKWGLRVPNSASFFLDAPNRSYVGEGLSRAFAADKRGDVRIFYRVGT